MSGFKDVVSSVLPFIGSLIGGPFGGKAASMLAEVITGNSSSSEEEIMAKITNANPELIAKLRRIDIDFKKHIIDADIETIQISALDRANARKKEIMTSDKMPAILSLILSASMISIIATLMFHSMPEESRQVVNILTGSVGTAWLQSVTYYFGTNKSSQNKTEMIYRKK